MSGMLMFSRSRSRSLSSMDSRTSRSVCIRSLVISLPRSTFSPSVQRQNWGNGARVTLAPAWDSRRAHLSPHCSSHCREAQEAGLGGHTRLPSPSGVPWQGHLAAVCLPSRPSELTSYRVGAMKLRQYSSTSYTMEKASSRTSCGDSAGISQLLGWTLPSPGGVQSRSCLSASSSALWETQKVSSHLKNLPPSTHHQKPSAVGEGSMLGPLCEAGWEMLTLFCFPELFSFVCGHSFPMSSIFISATGTGASRGAVSDRSPLLSPRSPALRGQQSQSMGAHNHLQLGGWGAQAALQHPLESQPAPA